MSNQGSPFGTVAPMLMVELLYEAKPGAFAEPLFSRVQGLLPHTELISKADSDTVLIAHLDHMTHLQDGSIPAQTAFILTDSGFDPDRVKVEVQQTFEWPEANETVLRCRASVLMTEMFARTLEYKTRLGVFQKVLLAATEVTKPLAIRWHRILPPSAILTASGSNTPHAIERLALNVRFFRFTNHDLGDMLMDTRGLAELGLPDLQIHYRGLQPGRVAAMLYNSALYIYEHGDVIQNGHTMDGLEPGQKWRCQHEAAMLGPERVVLDINPGPPFAAGTRQ